MTTRLIIADDEPDVLLLLRVQLRGRGFAIVGEASDAVELLHVCDQVEADVAVVDLLMPGAFGLTALVELRAKHPDLALIAYTAVAGEYVRAQTDALGITLLLKTGDADALVSAIESAQVALQTRPETVVIEGE